MTVRGPLQRRNHDSMFVPLCFGINRSAGLRRRGADDCANHRTDDRTRAAAAADRPAAAGAADHPRAADTPRRPRTPGPRRERRTPRVLLTSIDGLRPHVLLRADTPRIGQLWSNGSFT